MEKTFIFAGFGGQGMLLIGKFMAMACMLDGKHVSWLPSYGPEMRGGTANCSVIVSDNPVASPLVNKADVVVAMNRPSLDKFEEHVKPGGVLVINSSIIDRKAERDDIQVVYCDANGIAESVGNPKGANVAILGALMEKAPVVSNEILGEAIRIELGEKKAKFLEGEDLGLPALFSPEELDAACQRARDLNYGTDRRASAAYRAELAEVLSRRAILEAAAQQDVATEIRLAAEAAKPKGVSA